MPIYLDIDRLGHVVMIVAHGEIGDADIRKAAQELLAADVATFAKIIDATASVSRQSVEQVAAIARMMREGPGNELRAAVPCVVDPHRPGFSEAFAEQSAADRPIRLFTSLREARQWAVRTISERR